MNIQEEYFSVPEDGESFPSVEQLTNVQVPTVFDPEFIKEFNKLADDKQKYLEIFVPAFLATTTALATVSGAIINHVNENPGLSDQIHEALQDAKIELDTSFDEADILRLLSHIIVTAIDLRQGLESDKDKLARYLRVFQLVLLFYVHLTRISVAGLAVIGTVMSLFVSATSILGALAAGLLLGATGAGMVASAAALVAGVPGSAYRIYKAKWFSRYAKASSHYNDYLKVLDWCTAMIKAGHLKYVKLALADEVTQMREILRLDESKQAHYREVLCQFNNLPHLTNLRAALRKCLENCNDEDGKYASAIINDCRVELINTAEYKPIELNNSQSDVVVTASEDEAKISTFKDMLKTDPATKNFHRAVAKKDQFTLELQERLAKLDGDSDPALSRRAFALAAKQLNNAKEKQQFWLKMTALGMVSAAVGLSTAALGLATVTIGIPPAAVVIVPAVIICLKVSMCLLALATAASIIHYYFFSKTAKDSKALSGEKAQLDKEFDSSLSINSEHKAKLAQFFPPGDPQYDRVIPDTGLSVGAHPETHSSKREAPVVISPSEIQYGQ